MHFKGSYALTLSDRIEPNKRLLVGVAGIPASGKSTFSLLLANATNQKLTLRGQAETVILVGLDGWHLYRTQLDAMPDPKLAHDRRGVHWTFDGESYVDFIKSLCEPITSQMPTIYAPSFDHYLKDPAPNTISILPTHRIVIIEGLYTLLSTEPWCAASALLHERWFLDVPAEEAQRRLVKRHVVTGVAKDSSEAVWRAEENDMPSKKHSCPINCAHLE